MRTPLAACLTAALLLGGAGGALAQERGYYNNGGKNAHQGKANKGKAHTGGNKAIKKAAPRNNGRNVNGRAANQNRAARGGTNRNAYTNPRAHRNGYGQPRVTYGNRYRNVPPARRVYRGQVYRPYYGWQPVPYHYARRLHHRPGHRYYRDGNDVVMIAIATGIVVEVLRNVLD